MKKFVGFKGVFDLLEEATRLYKNNFIQLIFIGFVACLTGLVGSNMKHGYQMIGRVYTACGAQGSFLPYYFSCTLWACIGIASLCFAIWARIAIIKVVHSKGISSSEAYREAFRLTPSYLLVVTLTVLSFLGGSLLLVLPGLVFLCWFCFAPMVLICEGVKGTEALSRSSSYVTGRFWRVVWRLILPVFLQFLVSFALSFYIGSATKVTDHLISAVLFPFWTIYHYTLYKNLKESMPSCVVVEE